MKNDFLKECASVYADEKGQHRVVLPNGKDITHLFSTVVTDIINEIPICKAEFLVNLVGSREEAIEKYNL